MAKVDLDAGQSMTSPGQRRRIGFVATLHTMAFQETENQIGQALKVVQEEMKTFREANTDAENETVMFAVIGGDFNFDNVSPGDQENHDHALFMEYVDICAKGPGRDESWAVGTELRQLRIHDAEVDSAEKFKAMLEDPVMRRRYVIDADVKVS